MDIEMDQEILQDFLIEAGEMLETLGEQLIELEQKSDDQELLNAVFRAFHTIKGGAGFLHLEHLVRICHSAESVFDLLRTGERQIDGDLMDVVLRVLDSVNDMYAVLQAGDMPTAADPALIAELDRYAVPPQAGEAETAEPAAPEPTSAEVGLPATTPAGDDEITDAEFEALLDALQGGDGPAVAAPAEPSAPAPSPGDITDDEFEALLDTLQAEGKGAPTADNTASDQAPEESQDSSTESPERSIAEVPPQVVEPSPPATNKPADGPAAAEASDGKKGRPGAKGETSIRVETRILDDIMNMVGELVLVRNRMRNLAADSGDEELDKAVVNLNVVTSQLQVLAMKTRMQPIKKVFGRFPRVVRDISRSLKKSVELTLYGEETELDKNLVEALSDPLVHLVRNSLDHGVEMPDIREAAGKPRQGIIELGASQEGDRIVLRIKDDGAGMDPDLLRRKAVEKGMLDEDAAARLDDAECFALILAPGFSTKEAVSDISGRGVGMDVVKNRITQLNGSIEIESELGVGSTITIQVPLTLAILASLMVGVGSRLYAIPLAGVHEIFELKTIDTKVVDGQRVVTTRKEVLPLFVLGDWLCDDGEDRLVDGAHVVVVAIGLQRIGFVVDRLLGQEEVVIKPLGPLLSAVEGFAGATITGDGRMALILDVPGLIAAHR